MSHTTYGQTAGVVYTNYMSRQRGDHRKGPMATAAEIEANTIARLTDENARLKRNQERFIAEVMEYEGCREGKLEFLDSCGITFPSHTVKVTIVMNVKPTTDFDDVTTEIQEAVDNYVECNEGESAYVVAAEIVHGAAAMEIARGVRLTTPEGWVSL